MRNSEKRFCEVLRIRCTFSLKIQFFTIFGLTLGPDFEIFSQFQEMRLWITSLASYYLSKKRKTVLWGFTDPMYFFIEDSIFYNFWPNFGPRFWDIFSISGNALMNHFFSIVISFEKANYGFVRFCGSDAFFIKGWTNVWTFEYFQLNIQPGRR